MVEVVSLLLKYCNDTTTNGKKVQYYNPRLALKNGLKLIKVEF